MDQELSMGSSKPYLLRALYNWIVDNNATPYMLVSADYEGMVLPAEFVDANNQMVLNVSPTACEALTIGNAEVRCNARFSGQPMELIVPVGGVLAIYAKENGQGMIFGEEPGGAPPPDGPSSDSDESDGKRNHLKVVK